MKGPPGQGEEKRRGRGQNTSHTPVDPKGSADIIVMSGTLLLHSVENAILPAVRVVGVWGIDDICSNSVKVSDEHSSSKVRESIYVQNLL